VVSSFSPSWSSRRSAPPSPPTPRPPPSNSNTPPAASPRPTTSSTELANPDPQSSANHDDSRPFHPRRPGLVLFAPPLPPSISSRAGNRRPSVSTSEQQRSQKELNHAYEMDP